MVDGRNGARLEIRSQEVPILLSSRLVSIGDGWILRVSSDAFKSLGFILFLSAQ